MGNVVYEIKAVNLVTKTSKAGKPYQCAMVEYRDDQGKLQERTIMPFGDTQATFTKLKDLQPGTYTINTAKNEAGFWTWTDINAGGNVNVATEATTTTKPGATPAPRNTYETAEERAVRQKLIVRQSSLTNAIAFLELDKKRVPLLTDVLYVAGQMEAFVFGEKPQIDGGITELEDDIPL